jgi:hypothetical protein
LKRVSVEYSIIAYFMMFINFAGCGIKGNPVILSTMPDHGQIVQNMKAVSSDGAVILKWDFYDKNFKINYITVEKSEVGSAGNECKDCPRTFESIGQVLIKEERQKNKEYDSFSFTDKKVVHGKTYNYRLVLCDNINICFESSTAEINF